MLPTTVASTVDGSSHGIAPWTLNLKGSCDPTLAPACGKAFCQWTTAIAGMHATSAARMNAARCLGGGIAVNAIQTGFHGVCFGCCRDVFENEAFEDFIAASLRFD
ncbi:hypothetical protein ACOJBM_40470 [Rhizobium beringeri]